MIRAHGDTLTLTVDVAGAATMMESPAVSDLAAERIARGARAVRIDLRDCTTMDSTFSGMLLALKRRLERVAGTLTLVSPSTRVAELLQEMGVDDFYAVETADRIDGPWGPVVTGRAKSEKLTRVVIEAHDELAQLPGDAGRTFRTVVDELRRRTDDASPRLPDAPESMRTASFARDPTIMRPD